MPIYEFEGHSPRIADSSYVHETATLIGNVSVGEECFVGAGAVLRGDYGRIVIGNKTSVQENCVLHARMNESCNIGSSVQIGHGAVLHNCEVGDYAVIGLGSRICDYAVVGQWAIIGEGAVVVSKSSIPDSKVAVGAPAKVVREVTDEDRKTWTLYKQTYAELCERYRKGLRRII
jgi:phenylacetic acid degradation protein